MITAGAVGNQGRDTAARRVCEVFRLRAGVHCAVADSGELYLVVWPHSESLGRLTAGQRAVLHRLAAKACPVEELAEVITVEDGSSASQATDTAELLLGTLCRGAWLMTTIVCDDQPLYTLFPRRPGHIAQRPVPVAGGTLSRFAVLRRDGEDMLLESTLAACCVRVHDARVSAYIGSLTLKVSRDAAAGLPAEAVQALLADLWDAGFVVPDHDTEDSELRLAQWHVHELWFHGNSQLSALGRTGNSFGDTYWAKERFDPLPGRHDPFERADGRAAASGPESTARCRSHPHRGHRGPPVHPGNTTTTTRSRSASYGEFLFRCAQGPRSMGVVRESGALRPAFSSGGGVYELELYPLVRRVDGLEPGLYHYDAYEHRLVGVPANRPAVAVLAPRAAATLGGKHLPQVLLVVAARFGRLMGKYQAMSYALTLKHVGVFYQNLYLVATAWDWRPARWAPGIPTISPRPPAWTTWPSPAWARSRWVAARGGGRAYLAATTERYPA